LDLKNYDFSRQGPSVAFRDYCSGPGIFKDKSVVCGKLINPKTNVMNAIDILVSEYLQKADIKVVMSGHRPHGDTPCLVVGTVNRDSIVYIDGDTLYSNRSPLNPNDKRGHAYSIITIHNQEKYLKISVKGADGQNVKYDYHNLVSFIEGNLECNDPYIGRVFELNDKHYIVRMNNFDEKSRCLPLLDDDNENNNEEKTIKNAGKMYILTSVEGQFKIEYYSASENFLQSCKNKNKFLNDIQRKAQAEVRYEEQTLDQSDSMKLSY